jgi:hypothetical protein
LPTGHEDSPFFLFLFMQCLPKELRIVLREVDDHEDMRAMAIKADKLWSLHNHQQHGVVASVDPGSLSSQPPASIATVKSGPLARGGRSGGQGGKGRGRGGAVATAATKPAAATPLAVVTPDSMVRASSGSATSTGGSATAPPVARASAVGRETSLPGVSQRRYPPSPGLCVGSGIQEAIPCRHWCELQHIPALVIIVAYWSAAGWPLRNSNSLLG